MSDKEETPSPQENGSQRSDKSSLHRHSRSPSREASRRSRTPQSRSPHSRSRSRSHSRSYSRKHHSQSRSRSPSRRHKQHHYSRSYSRSPKYKRYSRSRSRSYSPRRSYSPKHSPSSGSRYYGYSDRHREYHRSHSHSPMSNRRRHVGNRENPLPSRCLGIFGLSLYTQERDLKAVFSEYGPLKNVQVVYDAQSGRSRGFAFVYFEHVEDAKEAKENCSGLEIDGRKIRVDYSITQRAHTPTPGIYMGKPTYSSRGGGSGSSGYKGRSPSPSHRKYSRSRSRSYSPRKYGYY